MKINKNALFIGWMENKYYFLDLFSSYFKINIVDRYLIYATNPQISEIKHNIYSPFLYQESKAPLLFLIQDDCWI